MPSIKSLLDKALPDQKWSLRANNGTKSYETGTGAGTWRVYLPLPKPDVYGLTETTIASFELREQLNCCGIMVLSDLTVSGIYKRKGLGRALIEVAAEMARLSGYSAMLVTYITKHSACNTYDYMNKLFASGRFTQIHTFKNNRTLNTVGISIMEIPK